MFSQSITNLSKIPPQARDMEEAVIGACLIDGDAFQNVVDFLKEEMFYVNAHSLIYGAMYRLYSTSKPIDILTVSEQLRVDGKIEEAGGFYSISLMTDKIGSSSNVTYHAMIIMAKYMQREAIRISNDCMKESYEDCVTNPDEFIEKYINEFNNVLERSNKSNLLPISRDAKYIMYELEAVRKQGDAFIGLPTGIIQIDNKIKGLKKSDLIILAARPGMGKTALMLSLAYLMAKSGLKIGIFSLEMSKDALIKRLVAIHSGIDLENINNASYTDDEADAILEAFNFIEQLPILIDDTSDISCVEIRSKSRKAKRNFGLDIIIVDYLQLMRGDKKSENRTQEISGISKSLKILAKELNIPVISLSQLSRSVESRSDKRPMLSDLRESGSIEQDADMVWFLYRPEYYGILNYPEGAPTHNKADLIISKYRNGSTGTIEGLGFNKKCARFQDEIRDEIIENNYHYRKDIF